MNTTQNQIDQCATTAAYRHAMIDGMTLNTFGKRLMLARKEAELTQEDVTSLLERRYGVSIGQTYISALENSADTAYVDGHLDPADYTAQVRRLRARQAQIDAEIERLETLAAVEAQRGSRRLRVADLVADGVAMLDSSDTTAANMWLRERLRVTIQPSKDISIDFI